jgi:hypothetical protein
MARLGMERSDTCPYVRRAVAALTARAVDAGCDRQSGGVGGGMAFARFDPLTGDLSSNPGTFPDFHALAVDEAGPGWTRGLYRIAGDLRQQTLPAPGADLGRTAETGGTSLSSMRHWQPVVAMDRIASNISPRPDIRGPCSQSSRPPSEAPPPDAPIPHAAPSHLHWTPLTPRNARDISAMQAMHHLDREVRSSVRLTKSLTWITA